METWAVVVAGGTGSRFGRPKQVEPLGDRRVLDHSIAAMRPCVTGVVVVGSGLGTAAELEVDAVVPGGETRSASVRNGLDAVSDTATHVLIHDAARPLVPADVVHGVVAAMEAGARAVVPVVPVTDTLRSADGGTVDRDRLVAVQTPQGFHLPTLAEAHAARLDATDDAGLVEKLGVPVEHVSGSTRNLKITVPDDLIVAQALLVADDHGGHEGAQR